MGPLAWGERRAYALRGCRDVEVPELLMHGFPLGSAAAPVTNKLPAHAVPRERRGEVAQIIARDCATGAIVGPFSRPPFDNCYFHPLTVVPKSDGGWRLIHNYSRDGGESLNAAIPDSHASVVYPTVDQAVNGIVSFGIDDVYLVKIDLANAFTRVPLAAADFSKTCFCWEGRYYFEAAIPMGARSSCKSFQRVGLAIQETVLKRFGGPAIIISYLDDALLIVVGFDEAVRLRLLFEQLCGEIGFPVNFGKSVGPVRDVVFLGILFDLQEGVLTLPSKKVRETLVLLEEFYLKKKCRVRELTSLLGKLCWACRVVRPGRSFLRRMYDLLGGKARFPHHHLDLNRCAKADLAMWLQFFQGSSGAISRPIRLPGEEGHFGSDASGGDDGSPSGFGVVHGREWSFGFFVGECAEEIICVKELFALFVCTLVWPDSMVNRRVIFHCDNQAVCAMVKKGSSQNSTCMTLLRRLTLFALDNNVFFHTVYIPSAENCAPDLLSRNRIKEFCEVGAFERFPLPLPREASFERCLRNCKDARL